MILRSLTYLDIDPTADLNRRLAADQMVFGLSPGQMAPVARIASSQSLIGVVAVHAAAGRAISEICSEPK